MTQSALPLDEIFSTNQLCSSTPAPAFDRQLQAETFNNRGEYKKEVEFVEVEAMT